MDKQQLLDKIEELELNRLNGLFRLELEQEYYEWFEGAIPENVRRLPDNALRIDLIEDFMQWRQQDSVEELQEKLQNYD